MELFFNALPTPCLLLLSDTPRFTIIGVNKAYCIATNTGEDDLLNKGVFEAFPDNPNNPGATGVSNIKASLELVIETKLTQKIDIQNYDIPVRGTDEFEKRYWRAENSPVLNEHAEIDYIIHSVTDITEKIKAEEGTEVEKRNREALINNTDDLIWSVDSSFKLIAANKAFIQSIQSYTGITLKPGDDLVMNTFFPEEFLESWQNAYRKAWSGEAFNEEIFTPSSNDFVGAWSEIRFNPILKENRVVGVACYSRDITESKLADEQHKTAEKLIRDSEAKYRAFFENSCDGMLLTITDGNIIAANPAACEIFRMTEKEICDAGRFGLADKTDPRLRILLEERQLTGKAKGELTLIRKDGSKFPGELTSSVFEDGHGKIKTSMIIRDITDRKVAETELITTSRELEQTLRGLSKIMDSSLDVICTMDETGRFVKVSAAAEKMWGYKPRELIGEPYIDFVCPEDYHITYAAVEEIRSGREMTNFENHTLCKDGSKTANVWSLKWNDTEKIMYCIAKDITEKKGLEKAFEIERQRFQDLYSQAPSCMGIIKGPTHIYELANPLYLQLIGKSDIIGKTVKQVLPELEDQGIFEILDTVYYTGETFSANEMLVKFDLQGTGVLYDTYLNFIYQAHINHEGSIDGIFFFAVDVTEQVLSRKKIEEKEKHYKELIRELPVATYSCDAEGRILIYNKAAAELWGREPEIGKDLWCGSGKIYTMSGELLPLDCCAMAIALKEGKLVPQREIIIERPNGDKRNVIPHPVPLIDSSGQVTGAVNMLTDITEIKAAEQHLKLLESVITNTHDAIMITEAEPFDEPGPRIIYVNEAFTEMTGFSFEEVIGQSPRILQGPKSDKDELRRLSESLRRWEPCEITTINYKRNGEEFWNNFSVSPVANANGWFTHWISIERDVTESKKGAQKIKEERNLLRTLIDNLPHAIYFKDEFARKLISNKVDYELLGTSSESEVLGKTDQELEQTELTINGYHQDIEILSTGRPLIDFEQYFIHENGKGSWFLTTKIPLRNEQDEIVGLLGIGRDITEKKHHETALRLKEQHFKALVQEGSDLISILDEKQRYTYLSPAYTSILGIEYEELIGTKALDRIHEDDRENGLSNVNTFND
ncbi:PAS domain S-box protein [Pedobacter sp. P351]|uniref:PAS domain S-box protein n=1 Tax=Pedobacter superstes TaxID=3133441 RepID=UPI00309B697F